MTLVKCSNCGNERDLTYDQIKTIASESRHCPSCGIGNERVVIREERFQPLESWVAANAKLVPTGQLKGVMASPNVGEIEEEPSGISVGPGGGISRRPRRTGK